MADFLLIHIDTQLSITQVISYDKYQNKAVQLSPQTVQSKLATKPEVILMVPASWVYLTQTNIASRSADILEKSIPYSIEDELVNDVEDNYYAWQAQSDHSQKVAVISKNKRHLINDFIHKQDIRLSAIYSEAVFCPARPQQLTLWQDSERVILRFGQDTAMVASPHQVPELVASFGQDYQQLLTNNPELIDTAHFTSVEALNLSDCCAHVTAGHEVNIYRGDDRDTGHEKSTVNGLKPLLAAAVLVVSWLAIHIYQSWQLSHDISQLKSRQLQVLNNAFGEVSPTEQRDPFAAMQSRLKQINQQNQPNNILLDGLYYLGEARQQQPAIQLRSIRLFDNNMEIQVTAPAISEINSYRQQLQDLAVDYRVNIGVNELTDGVYQSILTLKPR